MSNNLTVSPALLRESAGELKNKVQSVKANLGDATIEVNKVPNYYAGAASEEFMAKYNVMKPKFDNFCQVIEDYANFLIKTAESYETADATLAKQVDDYLA